MDNDVAARSYVWRALDRFAGYGDAEAIRAPGRTLTYQELRTAVLTMASALHEQGVHAGTSVAILVGNPHEAIFLQLSLHLLGCRSVWMIPSAPQSRAAHASSLLVRPLTIKTPFQRSRICLRCVQLKWSLAPKSRDASLDSRGAPRVACEFSK